MKDYISRQKFLVTCVDVYCKNCDRRKNGKGKMVYEIGDVPCRACDIRCVLDDVEIYPAADVAPVVHGRWEYNPGDNIPYCSECMMPQDSECNYCPSCGADMRDE